MKIYLASSFSLKQRVEEVSERLKKAGHTITVEWWNKDFKKAFGLISDDKWYKLDDIILISKKNFKGIDDADVLIIVCPKIESKKYNGANVELGYAIGKYKHVISLGRLERSAMYLGVKRIYNIEDLIEYLNSIEGLNNDR